MNNVSLNYHARFKSIPHTTIARKGFYSEAGNYYLIYAFFLCKLNTSLPLCDRAPITCVDSFFRLPQSGVSRLRWSTIFKLDVHWQREAFVFVVSLVSFVRSFACLLACLLVCLSVRLFVCLFVCRRLPSKSVPAGVRNKPKRCCCR